MNEWVLVIASAAAGFVHSAAGFGAALVAMPLLTLLLGVRTAAPTVALQGLITSSTVLLQNWRALDLREAGRLVLASLLGIPLGIWVLRQAHEGPVTAVLGAVLIGYAAHALLLAPRLTRTGPPAAVESAARPDWNGFWGQAGAWLAGFLAGILGGAYNTNGPPLIVYGTLKKWSQPRFKSVLQSVFLSNGIVVVGGHLVGGLVTPLVWRSALLSALPLIAGLALGTRVTRHLDPARFRRLVLLMVLLLGATLLWL